MTAQKQENFSKSELDLLLMVLTQETQTKLRMKFMGELYDLLSEQNKKQLQSMKDVSFQVLESYRNTDKDL